MTSVADDRLAAAAAAARVAALLRSTGTAATVASSPRTMHHTPASLLTHRIPGHGAGDGAPSLADGTSPTTP